MMVKGLLFFVLLISYFPNSYGGTRAAKRILEGLRRVAEAALVEGRYSRPDEPSAWSVRFINLDCRLTSDWDVAEGSRAAVQPNSAAGGQKRAIVRAAWFSAYRTLCSPISISGSGMSQAYAQNLLDGWTQSLILRSEVSRSRKGGVSPNLGPQSAAPAAKAILQTERSTNVVSR
jgi:hypothetical protein